MNQEQPLILVCDDDTEVLQSLHLSLRSSFQVHTASTVAKAKQLAQENEYDAAIIDLNYEGQELDGVHLLDFLGKHTPGTFLIVLSGDSSVKRVIEAMRRKLFEFIQKDGEYFDRLLNTLQRATQLKQVKRDQAIQKYLTQSPKVKDVLAQAERILSSASDAPILILGETGSGKEFLAQHIALNLKKKVIVSNMGAIPKDMAESILFGHEQGAFTGATSNKIGLIEAAHGGFLFLDEIGECSPPIQTKFLRVLQEKEVQPVGSTKVKKVNVRFIAATHRDLSLMVEQGLFRLDLLQRLNTFILTLPPLRERPEDVIFYSNMFLDELKDDDVRYTITPDGEAELLRYQWPGNIRELRSVIERIVVLSNRTVIDQRAVSEAIQIAQSKSESKVNRIEVAEDNAKREELIKALHECKGNKRHTAHRLGVSEATVYRWVNEYGLQRSFNHRAFKKTEVSAS